MGHLPGSLVDRISYGEARFYHGKLIRCQSYHDDYARSYVRVAMSGGDKTDSILECLLSGARGRGHQGPGCVPSWVTRRSYNGLTSGEILLAHVCRDGREDRCGSNLALGHFRLVVHPLQLGAMGPYSVEGTWLPSRIPLEGAGSDVDFSRP
jgi:hypothetical protein